MSNRFLLHIKYYGVLLFFIIISQLPCFISLLVSYPLKKLLGYTKLFNFSRRLMHYGFIVTDKLFFDIKYVNINNERITDLYNISSIKSENRYTYMGNHSSFVDSIITSIIPINTTPVSIVVHYAKYVPLLGWNLWLLDIPFTTKKTPYNSSNHNNSITSTYISFLNKDDNKSIAFSVFPTGKRIFTYDNDISRDNLKSGGFVIAKSINSSIIPVYHNILDSFNDIDKTYNHTSQVYCVIGNPISTHDKDIQSIIDEYHISLLNLKNHLFDLSNK